jgi:gp16 family phage-associated protein
MKAAVDRNKALHALRERKLTLKSWCEKHGYGYRTASDVLNGRNQAKYGIGKTIADALGRIATGAEQ